MNAKPYILFDGRCEEALEFYKRALGAEVTALMRFKESPEPSMVGKGNENKVMHCEFRVGTSTLMGSDGECPSGGEYRNNPSYNGFSLALTVADEGEAERLYNRLADNGKATVPLTQTFFAARFGMVTDKFGLPWMVVTEK
jgi:PhnB protein